MLATLWLDQILDLTRAPLWWPPAITDADGTLGPCLAMLVLGLIIVPMAAREMGRMFHANNVEASRRWMAIAAAAGLVVMAAVPTKAGPVQAVALVATVGTIVLVGSLVWHIRDRRLDGATAAVGAAMFAFVYLGLMFGLLLAIRREHSAWVVAGIIAITKSCDIGAYFTGKAIGKHKLIPWLSPGKSWEGLIGGIFVAAGVAMGALWLYRQTWGTVGIGQASYAYAALLGAVLAVTGQIGDLTESVFKRDAGVKDSGRTLPGFGGVLDVLDSILLTAPVAYWLLHLAAAA